MTFTLSFPGRDTRDTDQIVSVDSLGDLRQVMFAVQAHHEATHILATDSDGERVAELRFAWIDD